MFMQYVLDHKDALSEIVLGLILVARMIAALTPSKHDDEITSGIEHFVRRLIEVVSGAGHRNLVKDAQPAPVPVHDVEDDDPFEALSALVDKFGGKIVIIPKERN